MNITLQDPVFAQVAEAPTSKSAAHRVLIAAALADRPSRIRVSGAGKDIEATVRCLCALGADIKTTEENGADQLCVTPIGAVLQNAVLDCGESGSTLRFLVPVAAALGANATFIRRGRLPERPMEPLTSLLAQSGVRCTDAPDGSLTVTGRLTAGDYRIAADVSSQFITGLLLALTLTEGRSTLTLTGEIESAPYIEMTERALAAFGAAPLRSADGRRYTLGGQRLRSPGTLLPEGDFSGAAFPLAAGAIGKHPVTVTGLDLRSAQGDKAILDLLKKFGADVQLDAEKGQVTVSPAPLHGIEIDARQIPDLVPILAMIGATASKRTVITGAARLRLKESDRIATTAAMIRALGGSVTEQEDGLTVEGTSLTGGTVLGANDHRIVMSAAVASLVTDGAVTLTDAEAVAKSYPRFFELIRSQKH